MSLNGNFALSMPVNPRPGTKGWSGENITILVSGSSYPMDNVPTHQTTIHSYALEGNELNPRNNTSYNGLRGTKVRVYGSSVGRTEASGTGCG